MVLYAIGLLGSRGIPPETVLGMPWRYVEAILAVDQLGTQGGNL